MKEYIERAMAFAVLVDFPGELSPENIGLAVARKAIDALPAADVAEVKHGRWEFLGPNRLIKSCMCGTCSVCHVRSKFISNIAICPTCGAHMDGEIKNETN